MDTTILKGILTGLILSLPFGPVGVYCMELTIVEGRWKGYITALGMVTMDMVYSAVALLFLSSVKEYVEKYGFSLVRDFAGHGVGKEMHEDPMIPNYGRAGTGAKIENGMVITVEPMVNVGTHKVKILSDMWTAVTRDKKRSAQYEHSLAIIDGKPVILSLKD